MKLLQVLCRLALVSGHEINNSSNANPSDSASYAERLCFDGRVLHRTMLHRAAIKADANHIIAADPNHLLIGKRMPQMLSNKVARHVSTAQDLGMADLGKVQVIKNTFALQCTSISLGCSFDRPGHHSLNLSPSTCQS